MQNALKTCVCSKNGEFQLCLALLLMPSRRLLVSCHSDTSFALCYFLCAPLNVRVHMFTTSVPHIVTLDIPDAEDTCKGGLLGASRRFYM